MLDEISSKTDEMMRVVYNCIIEHIPSEFVYNANNQPNNSEQVPHKYAILLSSEGELVKHTLDSCTYQQKALIIVDVQVPKDQIIIGKFLFRKLKLLLSKSFAYNDTQIVSVMPTEVANDRGTRFNMLIEYDFLV